MVDIEYLRGSSEIWMFPVYFIHIKMDVLWNRDFSRRLLTFIIFLVENILNISGICCLYQIYRVNTGVVKFGLFQEDLYANIRAVL